MIRHYKIGVGFQPKTLEGFQAWVRKQELPMYRCHALATGGKHHTRDGYRFNTATGDAVIEVSAAPKGSPVYKIQQYDLPSMALAYREPVEDEMKNIIWFWARFLKTYIS